MDMHMDVRDFAGHVLEDILLVETCHAGANPIGEVSYTLWAFSRHNQMLPVFIPEFGVWQADPDTLATLLLDVAKVPFFGGEPMRNGELRYLTAGTPFIGMRPDMAETKEGV